jgi:antitoxin (DNA-binding transcriptional repressor) of toxin-antitoxin stability system
MDFVTVRELREKSGAIWQRVEAGEEFVVTRNGKPFALLVHTEPAEVEAALRAHRAARFGVVFRQLQEQARASGASRLTDDDIQAEIDAVRAGQSGRAPASGLAPAKRVRDARRR